MQYKKVKNDTIDSVTLRVIASVSIIFNVQILSSEQYYFQHCMLLVVVYSLLFLTHSSAGPSSNSQIAPMEDIVLS